MNCLRWMPAHLAKKCIYSLESFREECFQLTTLLNSGGGLRRLLVAVDS